MVLQQVKYSSGLIYSISINYVGRTYIDIMQQISNINIYQHNDTTIFFDRYDLTTYIIINVYIAYMLHNVSRIIMLVNVCIAYMLRL